jgi:hypothetical protein
MRAVSLLIVGLVSVQAAACSTDKCGPLSPEEQSSEGCLLTLGDVPDGIRLPGLKSRVLDPAALKLYLGESAKSRTWSEPDREEPETLIDHIEVSDPRIEVHATRGHGHTGDLYGMETLTIRMPEINLPCGLRVGSPVETFFAKLGPPIQSEAVGRGRVLSYDWNRYTCHGDLWWAEHATIDLFVNDTLTVDGVRWYYYAD